MPKSLFASIHKNIPLILGSVMFLFVFTSYSHAQSVFPGDVNGDLTVNLADLSTLLSNFGKSPTTRQQGNVAGNDTIVNLTDLSMVLANFGKTGGPTPTTVVNPTITPTRTPTRTPTPVGPTFTPTRTPTPTSGPTNTPVPTGTGGQISTDANLKVAFIGDTSYNTNTQQVWDMIKTEGAQLVVHSGDIDYDATPTTWKLKADQTFGVNFPYLASDGNHESWTGDEYSQYFTAKVNNINPAPTQVNLNGMDVGNYTLVYRGLKMVFVQEFGKNPGFINTSLNGDNHVWKICSWHQPIVEVNVGFHANPTTDTTKYDPYEACRQQGAIIVNGHNHDYTRTKTLTKIGATTTYDAQWHPDSACLSANPTAACNRDNLLVTPGKTAVFISGAGGYSQNTTLIGCEKLYPYNGVGTTPNAACARHILAKVYGKEQAADDGNVSYGALFITFNVNGDSNKAIGYFKNINGRVVDNFTITKQ